MATDDWAAEIEQIGQRLVRCERHCDGIVCNRSTGQIPRCHFFKTEGRDRARRGAIVVGLNPGPATERERKYYLDNDCSYEAVKCWMHDYGLGHRHYKSLRRLLDALELTGPILWTELAKCENAPSIKVPPLQTFRNCTAEYLQHEIECLPSDWPLFGIGREAYQGLAYRFPLHTVIGVPHPASWGQFAALFDKGLLQKRLIELLTDVINNSNRAVWLTAETTI